MRAVVIEEGELRVEERPDPEPGDTEVLIAVRAAGLNGADMLQRQGRYPAPPGIAPDVPGLEAAGEIVAVGRRVARAQVGDRVMAVIGGGGQATLATVDESLLLPVPEGRSWAEAGGFPEAYTTAHDALFTRARLALGERLLVTGAAGGVGVAAVQLGVAAGAAVTASVRDPARRDAVRALGADAVVGADDIADHGPYDVVLELVGAASLPQALRSLAIGARIAVIGVGSGPVIDLDLRILMRTRATIGASTLRARGAPERATVAAGVRDHVLPLFADGRVGVPVCATYPLEKVEQAYARFTEGGKLGKVVLLPEEP